MNFGERINCIRDNGPQQPLLRFVLLCLALWDKTGDDWVFGGRLVQETGYSERAVREALRCLVLLGWLRPEKGPSSTLPASQNQYGAINRQRVHSHLGGCRIGGEGNKTRYQIAYLTAPVVEPPRGRNVAKGERGAAGGGTGRRYDAFIAQQRGNGAPQRGNGAPNKGAPRSPDREGKEKEIYGGVGTPPTPRKGGEPVSPYGEPEPPQAADAAAVGAAAVQPAPHCPLQFDSQEAEKLQPIWSEALRQLTLDRPTDTGVKLYLINANVRLVKVAGDVAHLLCPTVTWAAQIEMRYAATLVRLLSDIFGPISTLSLHPIKEPQ